MAQLPPAAEAANIRQHSTTYQQLLADRAHDAVWDNPRAYLAGYRFANEQAGAEAIPAPVALLDQTVLLSDRQPMTFLCLVPRRDTYLVYVLHRFMRYLELPGERPTGFDDQVMALLGDIRPAQIPVVDVPPTTFHLAATAMVRIPTHAAMLAAGVPPANSVAADLLGPFGGDNDEGTELARPRHVQLIPSRYATDLVSEDGVHPRLVYQNLSAALVRDGTLEDCRDVLTWLRTASTARGGAGVQAGVPAVALSFPGLNLPQPVYQYVLSKVHGDLPALRSGLAPPAAAAFMPGAQHVADLMRAFAEGQAQRPDNAGHEREPKQVQDVYRETYQLLLRYSRVEQVDDLAPVWRRLANAAKSEQQTVLSQELTSVCLARGLAPELYAPVVSTSLKQMISGFAFAGTGPNELAGGCSPFLVTYTGARALQEAQDSAALTHQLEQGSQNASLADIRSIKDKERVRFPRDLHNVGITLQRYAVLLQCLFQGAGPPHPLVRSIWALADDFSTKLPFLLDSHQNLSREHPQAYLQLPVRILRYVQVVVIEYLQRIATAAAGFVEVDNAPRFNDLVQDLQWGTFHVSRNWIALPPYYAQLAFPSTSALTPTGRRLPGSDTTNTTTGSSGSSLNTGVSSLTSPSTTAPTQVRVVNETPDAEFMALELKPRLGELLRLHRPPASSDGGEHCVAWWAKGGCYSQCSRRSTHKAFSSPGERARLLAHIKEHLVVGA